MYEMQILSIWIGLNRPGRQIVGDPVNRLIHCKPEAKAMLCAVPLLPQLLLCFPPRPGPQLYTAL
jgi:hypothetical protein